MHNTMKLESPTSLVAVHARKFATVREIVTRPGNMSMNADADRQTMLHCALDGWCASVNNAERRTLYCYIL